jgi:hypothetical protein
VRIFFTSSKEFTFSSSIARSMSHFFIPAFIALLFSTGARTIPSSFIITHSFKACSKLGISFISKFVCIVSLIPIGLTQKKKRQEKIIIANIKFIPTHHKIIRACCQ